MHKPVILLHTIGNRDLQFPGSSGLPLDFQQAYLEKNTEKDAGSFFVLSKTPGPEPFQTFVKLAQEVRRRYETPRGEEAYRSAVRFPMLEAVIDFVLRREKLIDLLILMGTQQSPEHHQDTHPVAKLARSYLQNQERPIAEIQVVNLAASPTASGRKALLEECRHRSAPFLRPENQVYISNHQGLPDVSRVLDLLGFFQGYTYLAVHAKEGVSVVDHTPYEQILADLIQRKLLRVLSDTNLLGPQDDQDQS